SKPSYEAIQKALELNATFATIGFSKTNAFPGVDGEIQTTAYHGPLYLEFTIEPDGKISYICEHGNEETEYQSGLDIDQAIEIIRSFRGRLWALSASFINSTMTPIKEISRVLPSNLQVMEAESQSLTKSAFPRVESALANTLTDSTRTLQVSPLSFGTFQPINFLKITGSYRAPVHRGMSATTT
ncbi:MAG: hypothetical protein HYY33_00765, partial [Chloroflexi bacterium]|nr:hypothetical protein [Chloroflexota bacterium]